MTVQIGPFFFDLMCGGEDFGHIPRGGKEDVDGNSGNNKLHYDPGHIMRG